ncbi:response regulator transcription factor [Phycicoccus sp. MAQZ13P-2]|uniref:response regulator transcription factor n=1 Tax=Phycicoccus mangrovi TaxID=2840470 RepID=UPI001C004BA8|nr:response regulator transcription factor [Phycicoccus mangrovi]MBT9257153.1 response regulator transcription factor [Phycicoccus mangrovi]MBT9276348.1 response regulator transcription factor [Phycicoccus mangrovi]
MRVLVVEDEPTLAESIRRGLVGEGMVVEVAHDGVTGQWYATENPYDAIVLDIMLPGRNGYEVLARLRELKIWTPVLMLTAKDGEYDQTDAFDLGADDYLTKPFHFIVLVARLRALARRGAPERPVTLVVGDIVLDPVLRHVTCRGETVSLTAKQYALLSYLMRHPDQVLSKAEILDNVWDPAFDGSENIVEVYVGYLRKKLDTAFGRTSIETVRGMGYRLRSRATPGSSLT